MCICLPIYFPSPSTKGLHGSGMFLGKARIPQLFNLKEEKFDPNYSS